MVVNLDYKTLLNSMYAAAGYELGRILEAVKASNLPVGLKIPGGLEVSVVKEIKNAPWENYFRTYSNGYGSNGGFKNSNAPHIFGDYSGRGLTLRILDIEPKNRSHHKPKGNGHNQKTKRKEVTVTRHIGRIPSSAVRFAKKQISQ